LFFVLQFKANVKSTESNHSSRLKWKLNIFLLAFAKTFRLRLLYVLHICTFYILPKKAAAALLKYPSFMGQN